MRNRAIVTWLSIIFTAVAVGTTMPVAAQSFYEPNSEGEVLYYDVLTPHSVEVAFNPRHIFYKRVIHIPDHVVHNDTNYIVVSIGNMAFYGYEDEIDSIILPHTIANIGRAAFGRNKSLHTIVLPKSVALVGFLSFIENRMDTVTVLAETPPKMIRTDQNTTTSISPFVGTDLNSCILQVPSQSVKLYKHDPYWGRFKNIRAIHVEQPQPLASHTDHKTTSTHSITTTQYRTTNLSFDGKDPEIDFDDNLAKITISYCNQDSNTIKAPYDIALYEGGGQGTLRSISSVSDDLAPDSCTTQNINLPNVLIKRLCTSGTNSVTIAVNDNVDERHSRRNRHLSEGNTVTIPLSIRTPVIFDTTDAPYLWCGKYRTESGTYYDTTVAQNGCITINTLQLLMQKDNIIAQDTAAPITEAKTEVADEEEDVTITTADTLHFPTEIKLGNKHEQQRYVIQNLLEGNGYGNNVFLVYDRRGKQVFSVEDLAKEEDFWTPSKDDIRPGKYYWHFIGNGSWGHIDRTGSVTVTR